MGVRTYLLTGALNQLRDLANVLGCQLVIEGSDHSLETSFESPDKNSRAWDSDLYRRGQLYIKGYANPVKLSKNYDHELENPDTAELEESDKDFDDVDEELDKTAHTELISSPRYREYMRQDLISQLLNPRAQWRLLAYAVIALGILMTANIIISAAAAGAF